MLRHLRRVQRLVRHQQEVRVVLLLSHYQLPEVDWASNCERVVVVYAHAVGVAEVGDAPEVGQARHVGEEAHALQPTMPPALVHGDGQLVPEKLLENGAQQVDPCVLPEPAVAVQQLVPEDVRDHGQLVVGAALVELQQRLHEVVGQREPLPSYVLVTPELDLEVRVHLLRFPEEVVLGGRQLAAQPHLVDHFGDQLWARAAVHGSEWVALIEGQKLGERHLEFKRVEGHVVHIGELEPRAGAFQLAAVHCFEGGHSQEGGAGNDGEGIGNVELSRILLAEVVQARQIQVCQHHLN